MRVDERVSRADYIELARAYFDLCGPNGRETLIEAAAVLANPLKEIPFPAAEEAGQRNS